MALNFPGPGELRIFYTVDGIQHVQKLNINTETPGHPVGTEFSLITGLDRFGTSVNLATFTDNYVTVMRPFFASADATIDLAEFWEYEPDTFDATYKASYPIGLAGTSAGTTTPASQRTWTFRTREGGHMRVTLLEIPLGSVIGAKAPYASLTTINLAFADFFLDAGSICLARDTSFPAACIYVYSGQNEKTFRQRFR